ncbi:hypothetical protein GCM10007276_26410 [Agaricicola taiwanensis]|uniref:PAS domain-containing protein n=1 Tax=Agaricicola taiwanensis TaxID=591372 RepID=A0A8J3DVJ9_9RHOB|nr:PAS domain-containing protein [Agaricicola taiwanensis]GGE47892.1 hypothetical protein GCM10007276_26410 [Agaricicola taiwanensis]
MKLHATQDLYRIWTALRGARPAPDRAEIDPAQLVSVLPYVFLLETLNDSRSQIRLAGTHVCAAFDAELRGRPFQTLWRPEDHGLVGDLIETISTEAAAVVIGASEETAESTDFNAELLLLPLRTLRPGVNGVLGSCVVRTTKGLPSRHIRRLAIDTQRVSWPSGRRTVWQNPPVQTPLVHVGARREGRFFVYDGGRN